MSVYVHAMFVWHQPCTGDSMFVWHAGDSMLVYSDLHKSLYKVLMTIWLVLSAWTINLSSCTHLSCSMIRASEVDSLVTASFTNQSTNIVTNISNTDYTVVCLSQGVEIDTWRFISLVALYTYNGTNHTSQFQFECVESKWTAIVNGSDEYIRTDPPDASINTTLRTDCALCIDPQQAMSASNPQHCLGELHLQHL